MRYFHQCVYRSGTVGLRSRCMACSAASSKERKHDREKQRQSQAAQNAATKIEQTCQWCHKLLPSTAYRVTGFGQRGYDTVCSACRSTHGLNLSSLRRAGYAKAEVEQIPAPSKRRCNSCRKENAIEDFGKDCNKPTGFKLTCKACLRLAAAGRKAIKKEAEACEDISRETEARLTQDALRSMTATIGSQPPRE